MNLFRRTTSGTEQPPVIAGFGKLPFAGDFLHTGSGDSLQRFELLLQRAMEWGDSHRPGFREAYARGGVQAFSYRMPLAAKDPCIVVGLLKPSYDSVGRRYPIGVAVRVPSIAFDGAPYTLPLVFADFLEQAAEVLLRSSGWRSVAEFQAEVDRIPKIDLGEVLRAKTSYTNWTHAGVLGDVWTTVFGAARDVMPAIALRGVLDATEPFRGRESPKTLLGVRLPLGDSGSAGAAFWLDVVCRAAGWANTIPSFFWSQMETSLLIQMGDEVPVTFAADLWCPDEDSAHVFTLSSASQVANTRGLPPHIEPLIRDPARAVAELAACLSQRL